MSHFLLMLVFALMISVFFGAVLRDSCKETLRFSVKMFFILTAASLALAWILLPFPP